MCAIYLTLMCWFNQMNDKQTTICYIARQYLVDI